jgi:8-oxo-dGTP pyrophosphatase MutT (NUDIX family)
MPRPNTYIVNPDVNTQRNAFVCMIDTESIQVNNPRIFVVLVNTRNGQMKWTLPGGKIDKNESVRSAAMRELREETAYTPTLHDAAMYTTDDDSTFFFVTPYDFYSTGHDARSKIFSTRAEFQNPVETHDYGFARKEAGNWVIRNYAGTEKNIQDLRAGTVEGLEFALRHVTKSKV